MNESNAIIDLHDKLKEQDKQIARELADNNGLREIIMIYSKAFDSVEALAFGEEGLWVDILNKISKDLHEAVLKQ